ncbi:GTP-binding protein 6 [Dorcoceras hygrometricum]|uniref:GTP-binding protein 6 n=1 Tax=Dorcoceras hygrometricum TaxID=472368 RepID=A0A2Z7B4G9_9LAMI|nr:GTP-binding protein 6 [Dorcoceras hygrometricum]
MAVHADGVGVVYPDDAVSDRNTQFEVEPEDEVHGVVNEVPGTHAEEAHEPGNETRLKKTGDLDENDINSRFKLRNGREVFEEKAYIVGVARKGEDTDGSFGIEDSLSELEQLAETAGLTVVGSTYQKLAAPNSRTYIGSGKVAEIKSAIHAFDVETVIFDDELSPGQLRNLEKVFGGDVSLAQMEYQLPRLTRMWTHLERQSGGQVKGMGEKQIEVDKRILRDQIAALKKEIESIRKHRKQYRNRRVAVPVPVVSLVGYTNAGKSTLLNRLTGADVLAEDKLFATLDPTTRRVQMKNGKEFLLTDTVGFIQKLPTTLVAAFRATLEEISESSLLVHVVDISHPLIDLQIEAVDKVLSELKASSIPKIIVWNKVDNAKDPEKIRSEAKRNDDVVCISALTGEGLDDFCDAVQEKLKDMMVWVEALIPFDKGELLSTIHKVGMVEKTSTEVASEIQEQKSEVKRINLFSSANNSRAFETDAILARRQLREKRREKRAADLVKQDHEVTVKLENAAIERSKSVDSAVLGKYSIWRKEYENENSDSVIRLMRDQMIMAKVYVSLARMKNKLELVHELQIRLKESQRSLGEATADSDLQQSALEKMKAMGQVLSKAREQLYDCKLVTGKLRAMLQSTDELVHSLKRQSDFLSQLAAKTIPNGLHCLSLRLSIDYHLLPPEKRKFPRSENLEDPNLYHYALFSDNVLAASVVVNSTIVNAKPVHSFPPGPPLEISSALMAELITRQGQPSRDLGVVAFDAGSHEGSDTRQGIESCDGRELGQSSLDVDMTNALKRKKVSDAQPPQGSRRRSARSHVSSP